ncbi:hypothetical protein LXL04_025127 [Taraxacum kok-saghyz]
MVDQIEVMMCQIVGTVCEIEEAVFDIAGAVFDSAVWDNAVWDTAVVDIDIVVVFATTLETPAGFDNAHDRMLGGIPLAAEGYLRSVAKKMGYSRDAPATVLFDEWFRFGKPSDQYPHNVALTTFFRLMIPPPSLDSFPKIPPLLHNTFWSGRMTELPPDLEQPPMIEVKHHLEKLLDMIM